MPSDSIKCRISIFSAMLGSRTEGFCRPSRRVSSLRATRRLVGISAPVKVFQSWMSSCFILCDGDFSMILAAATDRREILLPLPRDQDDGDLRKPRRICARACGRISISYGVAARGLGVARLVNRLAKFAAIDFGFFAY